MTQEDYKDPVLAKYGSLIDATKRFKRIFYGDPIRIAASELPAIVLAKVDTVAGKFTNAEDIHQMRISFTVVTDVRDTISEDKTMVRGVNELYNLVEGRLSNYQLRTDSLLYILRHNEIVDAANNLRTDLSTMSKVDYGMTMGKRQEGAWSIEGTLEITTSFTQVR